MACYSLLINLIWISIIWWLILLIFMFYVSASQLFVNCWVRAIASIVRAKRLYSDDILNNFFESIPFFYSLYVFLSSSLLLFFFFLLLLFIFSSYTGRFRLQWKTALPVHCYGQIYKNIKKSLVFQWFFTIFIDLSEQWTGSAVANSTMYQSEVLHCK